MSNHFYGNPWGAQTFTEPAHSTPSLTQLSPSRAARRVRAANDPLVSPSRAHIDEFELANRKRALKDMLECIDDAISTPLPHNDIHMARVRADADVTVPEGPPVEGLSHGSPGQKGAGLAISLPKDSGVLPLQIPRVPGRPPADGLPGLSYGKSILSVSEGSTVAHMSVPSQQLRTIKTVKHLVS
ncbi:hypothetical protein EC988_004154, partial [Linderina pennispora]